ncbi:DUF4956 domain-containing protein [Youxingia wuxianensis]
MLDMLFESVTQNGISVQGVLFCTVVSLVLGICVACIYMFRNSYSKSFVVTLALLPAMVQIVIMLVNGNLGAGVAVMGAFGLVRFRSVPGTAREISSIFFAMAIGLATGMGYLGYAGLFLIIVGLATLGLSISNFGREKVGERELKITIPENLDYEGIFDDLFQKYTSQAQLIRVRTTNMGSLYELQYLIHLKGENISKEFLDELRCRNGNLNIVCGRVSTARDEL